MIAIHLQDLPKWSLWPARIMGIKPWEIRERTPEKITEEYDTDKYAKCLGYANASDCNMEELKRFELGDDSEKRICVSYGDDLCAITVDDARREMCILRRKAMEESLKTSRYVIELGCGYGYNLHVLQTCCTDYPAYIGGEYSGNAVELGSHFVGFDVIKFDFLDPDSYTFLDDLDGPITIFTCHAIEQLKTVTPVLDALTLRKDKIQDVFHFEPLNGPRVPDLLNIMRQRYTELNGYNRDLIFQLDKRDDINVKVIQLNLFGMNPLNPTSIIHWRFR